MKTKLFLSALTLGAMMTTFVACDKEEPYVDPGKVIESEVVDPGTAEEVEETDNGTEGILSVMNPGLWFIRCLPTAAPHSRKPGQEHLLRREIRFPLFWRAD